jgi:hypothetical protein
MIFQTFDSTDIVAGRVQAVSTGMFGGGEPHQTHLYTSSLQSQSTGSTPFAPLNGLYYLDVYDTDPNTSLTAEVYASVTYGHTAGSGSSAFDLDGNTGSLIKPTQAIYSQYRNLLLTPGDQLFTFLSGSTTVNTLIDSPDIYVINFSSAKVKDKLDQGQFEIRLTGANGNFTFIDDSRYNTDVLTATGGKRFNLLSGSLSSGQIGPGDVYKGIGSVYPDLGIIIFNPNVLQQIVGNSPMGQPLGTPAAAISDFAMMHRRFYSSISPSSNASITARVTEYVPSRHYFVRVKNQTFNYSNNPSFVVSSDEDPINAGNLRFSSFSTDPKVYITTVGLYNSNNDLVAVAKLSQPILKDFGNECLIRIRLDF